jgi:hypothetical protein
MRETCTITHAQLVENQYHLATPHGLGGFYESDSCCSTLPQLKKFSPLCRCVRVAVNPNM